jgi:WD40 repeat protein
MIPDEITPIEESWVKPLLDAEGALLGDQLRGMSGAPSLPTTLDGVAECLHLLEQLWPRAEFSTPTGAQVPLQLGRFQIVRELGRGGFGIVFLAHDPVLGREVALKVPRPDVLDTAQLRRRFSREARAAAALDHPNIVSVLEAGELGGIGYIVSTYHEGSTLAGWLKGRFEDVPPRTAAHIVAALADGIQHAHEHGILHRDLKPGNVLLTASNRSASQSDRDDPTTRLIPRITDFGLAKTEQETTDVTRSGVPMGSPPYMAPEQASGDHKAVGPVTDVYALGAILYEILTGQPPFRGESPLETLHRVLYHEPIRPRTLRLRLPHDLETICLKCLEKDRTRRYDTARALSDDLCRFLGGEPIRARPVPVWEHALRWARRRPNSAALIGLAMLAVCCAVGGGVAWSTQLQKHNEALQREIARADRHARDAEMQTLLAEKHRLLAERHFYAANLRLARQALDARQLERAQDILNEIRPGDGAVDPRDFAWHYLRRLARGEIIQLRGLKHRVTSLALSPDGRTLAARDREGTILLWDLATEEPRAKLENQELFADPAVFSPDGQFLATCDPGCTEKTEVVNVAIWEANTGRLRCRLSPGSGRTLVNLAFLAENLFGILCLLPDGTKSVQVWDLTPDPSEPLLCTSIHGLRTAHLSHCSRDFAALEGNRLTLRNARTGRVRLTIPGSFADVSNLVFSPDGRTLAGQLPGEGVVLWELDKGQQLDSINLGTGVDRIALNSDGRTLCVVDETGQVHLKNWVTGQTHLLDSRTLDSRRTVILAFSPDSRNLALAAHGGPEGPEPVTLWSVSTGQKIGAFPGRREQVDTLVFTPDSRSVIIGGGHTPRIWLFNRATELGSPSGHAGPAWSVAISPDGKILASGSDDTHEAKTIKLWELPSGRPFSEWNGKRDTVSTLAFHPNGRILASGHLSTHDNVQMWEVPTGKLLGTLVGHSDKVLSVAFHRDGSILASAGSDRTIRLWEQTKGRPIGVLSGHQDSVRHLAFSPDGRLLASASDDGTVRLWDLVTGETPRVLRSSRKVSAVAFSPDGETLASADAFGNITLWNVGTGVQRGLINSDDLELLCLGFTPDGRNVATAGMERVIRLWDVITGQELLTLEGHKQKINALAFSSDGSILASCSHDGAVNLWLGAREPGSR